MIKSGIFFIIFLITSQLMYSQIKLHSNGNISIATTVSPSTHNTIYIYGPRLTFGGYGNRFFKFDCSPSDPRWWSSTGDVVFYDTEKGRFCDIQAKSFRVASDIRYKTEISELENSLDKILSIDGVSFFWQDANGLKSTTETTPTSGFIAQDIEKVIPNLVYSDSTGYKTMDYIGLLPYVVESIKELNQKVETQEEYIQELEAQVGTSTGSLKDVIAQRNESKLYSNNPNPFNTETTIKYFVSTNASKAYVTIYDLNGKQLMSNAISNFGEGEILILAGDLSAGMFLYSLIVDGILIDTKKMIITD